MKKVNKSIITLVFIGATVMPNLQQISICFHTKSHLFNKAMAHCTPEDHECMVDAFVKVCQFNKK